MNAELLYALEGRKIAFFKKTVQFFIPQEAIFSRYIPLTYVILANPKKEI